MGSCGGYSDEVRSITTDREKPQSEDWVYDRARPATGLEQLSTFTVFFQRAAAQCLIGVHMLLFCLVTMVADMGY